jgi:DNA-binding transcriptional ArsR family regulator
LELLADGERSARELANHIQREFGLTQPADSQHLRVLRESGFTAVRPDGARRIYSVEGMRLRELDAWLDQFRSFWQQPLDALATEIARGKRKRRKQ